VIGHAPAFHRDLDPIPSQLLFPPRAPSRLDDGLDRPPLPAGLMPNLIVRHIFRCERRQHRRSRVDPMFASFSWLLDTSPFPPRWECGSWSAAEGWLHILSDLGVWSAYVAIPCVLAWFVLRRRDIPFRTVFWLFGAFILACGTTHLMEALLFWWPAYHLAGVIKLLTALVSWATVVALIPVIPRALAMRSPEELEREIAERQLAEEALRRAHDELEQRVRDRTADLVRLNATLEEREHWFTATLESIGDGVIATDSEGRVVFLNRVAENLTGWRKDEAVGRSLEEVLRLVHGQTRQGLGNPLRDALRQRTNVPLGNHSILLDRSGTERPIDDCASPILDKTGVLLGGVMVFRDVTERYRVEEKLHREQMFTEQAVESLPGVFYLFDQNGRFLRWNRKLEQVSGYSGQEIARLHPSDFFDGPDKGLILDRIGEVFARGEATAEAHLVSKDGRTIPFFFTGKLVEWGGSRCLVGMGVDLSEHRLLEERYRHAQKMEAVGRLAGGIAHDFNNLLTAINGFSSLLLDTLHDNDGAREMLEQISRAGDRAASLTQQLLAYSRKQILQPRELDLNELVAGLEKMLRRMIGEDIELATTLAPGPCPVKADPGQLQQVIMNLALNARDAMPSGGRLTLATALVELPEEVASGEWRVASEDRRVEDLPSSLATRHSPLATPPEVRPGLYVLLTVSDTGCGMTPEVQARIFEPFFTTKEPGKGTGLGLATVYGILEQSGGHIHVSSEPGRGTTFDIYLPHLPDLQVSAEASGSTATPGGTETVLLVEDEDAVRSLARVVLQRAGYTVLAASDGVEALEVSARHPSSLDLLVTDVVMPRLGGRQLAEILNRLHPRMRVLYLSGYTDDTVVRSGILKQQAPFLHKPFTLPGLMQKIRAVLDARADPEGEAGVEAGLYSV
jgi:PAS domain S-box-containing protein